MKKYFAQLRPMERRLVVAVAVVLLIVLNAMFIWPHFSDWSNLRGRMAEAHRKLKLYQTATNQIPALQTQVKSFASEGEFVALEDQAINLMRTIQAQASASGFGIQNYSRSMMRTNDAFFVEQVQNINVLAKEEQLVDFLYKLGSGASMIRVRDLELQPDAPRQRLNANIRLVASYQKNPAAPAENFNRKGKMKTILLALVLALTGLELWAQTPPGLPPPPTPRSTNVQTTLPRYQPTDPATTAAGSPAAASGFVPPEEMMPEGMINFQGVDVNVVLDIYAKLVNRTLLRAAVPSATIVLKTQTQLTKSEAIQALQAVLALNGISVVNIGDKFVKVGPVGEANTFGAEFNTVNATNLPDLGGYLTHIVQLKYVKPTEMMPIIAPFAKLANSILPIDSNGILILRDNAENVKRMLEMIERIDVSVPAEYISEVIPILYAAAADIASALNSLGGSGGSTVSFGGTSSASATGSGTRSSSSSGLGMSGGLGSSGSGTTTGGSLGGAGSSPFGGTTRAVGTTAAGASGTPTSGTTFQQRLQSIINRASGPTSGGSGQDQIQVFGQTKIIADQRSNSLLVFATRQDMENIKRVVSQLDVLLSQVLIESIIMDVSMGNNFSAGVSAIQKPKQFNNSNVSGGGAMLNGSFWNTIQTLATNGGSSSFGTNLTGGLSYFGSIGDTWDIAVRAAESDNTANIIQRPRIQTSQATPAQFFVGQTVPYVTSTYGNSINGGYGGSSYDQLSVGVLLEVTPFINPDGLVVMEVNQEIDELAGSTAIAGVGDVPNTIKRTLNSQIAVKNRDTVILGGFVRSDKSHTRTGIPVLMDIPLLGWLFSKTDNKKDRTELIVMMRPTVLKTPEIAVRQTIKEVQRLPLVTDAAAEDAAYERKLIEAQRKKELKNAEKGRPADFFNKRTDENDTNAPDANFGAGQPGSRTPAPAAD